MSPDNEGADLPDSQEQAATGLDAILGKAMEGMEFDAPEKSADAPPDKGADTEELKADAAGRLHGKDGKFAPKDSVADAAPSEDGASKAPDKVAPDQSTAEPAKQQFEPHARWNEAQKAAFATLTPEAKKFALDVQAEHEANFTRKSQEYAEFKRTADPYVAAVQPFQQYLAQIAPATGMSPPELVRSILSAEYSLRTGDPGQKYAAFAQLAQAYGVDIAALSRGEVALPDPALQQLRQQVSELSQWRQQREQQTNQEQDQRTSLLIDQFEKATDESGKPKHPYFDMVRAAMGQIASRKEKAGEPVDLEAIYQEAAKPLEARIASSIEARQKQAVEAQKDALDKAKKAAPIKSSGSAPNGSVKGKGLDAIIGDSMAKHGF